MKKIIAMSIIATGMLFSADINLGVVQANGIAGLASASNGSAIKQGDIEVYGANTKVSGIVPLVPNAASVNAMGLLVVADNNSTVEQGTIIISNSDVKMNKVEGNAIVGGVIAKNGSTISQGKWDIRDVNHATVSSVLQVNGIVGGAIANGDSEIAQGGIAIGSVDSARVIVTGANALAGGARAKNGSTVSQGNVKICGGVSLAACGS
ncbi:hypothetical protein MNB_SV-12-1909 [hydrothermal vent metagenome]|uniref:Uncharacterized protein n=1 Tax=hydrothermal vent metagenome TaxID=652676 RepID=A0A1W1BYQ6_9ZZZZ